MPASLSPSAMGYPLRMGRPSNQAEAARVEAVEHRAPRKRSGPFRESCTLKNLPQGRHSLAVSAAQPTGDAALRRARLRLGSLAIHHVGGRDRRNDLTGSYDRTRVVRDIDVKGSMHHLV